MHNKKTKKLKITATSQEGFSVEAVLEVPADAEIAVSELPKERSPLHSEALTADELEVGMNVQMWNKHRGIVHRGMINGEPYQISDPDSALDGCWAVPVVAVRGETLVQDAWYLTTMGVAPYGDGHWSDRHYTLAAPGCN